MNTAADVSPPLRAPLRPITWVGLFLALFGMLIVRQVVNHIWVEPGVVSAMVKEAGMWVVALLIIAVIRLGEGQPLSSVGIGTSPVGKTILWGIVTTVTCLIIAVVLIALTHYTGGESGKAMEKLPLWLITLIVTRAGVVEELCYRGYAIERLQSLGLPSWLAAAIPLVIFAVGHWTGGWANIVIALALGGVLAGFYLWRRDLVANMIGHFLVDFVGNVLPKLMR